MSPGPIVVVGIGAAGASSLSPDALAYVDRAEFLAGGRRHLDFFPHFQGEKVVLAADPKATLAQLKFRAEHANVVILASGDPLFYGIGSTLLELVPRERLLFLPHVSAVQLAFARLGIAWHDACVASVHGRPMTALVAALGRREPKVAVLTDGVNDPAAVARAVVEAGLERAYEMHVCENLGGDGERLTRCSPERLPAGPFAPLNLVVLLRSAEPAPAELPIVGIPEAALAHRGLITRREVRLLSLCVLALQPDDVLWDIGAGSGSVSLEAARLAPRLRAFAVEKSASSHADLQRNIVTLGCSQIQAVLGEAPAALGELPDPDAVFIGGSGGRLAEILHVAHVRARSGARIVLNCITLDTLSLAWSWLRERRLEPEVTSVQLARSRPLGSLQSLEPDNLIFIMSARKP